MIRNLIVGLGLALGLGVCGFAGAQEKPPIRIGVAVPLTADLASYGTSVRDAIVLATEEINAKGGVLGRPIELVVEDDQSKPEQAKTVFEKLIKRDKVVAILGDVTSGCTLAAAPVAEEAKIPVLTPTATNERVTKEGEYIFRSCYTDSQQGVYMAKFALDDLKAKRFAVLYNVKDPYSVGLKESFVGYAKEHGGEMVAELSFSSGDADFKGQLTKIRRLKPEALYIPGYYSEIGPICRQARAIGLNITLLGSDGWDSGKTFELAGDAANGSYFTNHYSADDQRAEVQNTIKAFKAKYGRVPDALAVLAYEATYLLADAIQRADSTDGAGIREALANTRDFAGVTGTISINADRNARKPIVIVKVEDRQFRFFKSVEVK